MLYRTYRARTPVLLCAAYVAVLAAQAAAMPGVPKDDIYSNVIDTRKEISINTNRNAVSTNTNSNAVSTSTNRNSISTNTNSNAVSTNTNSNTAGSNTINKNTLTTSTVNDPVPERTNILQNLELTVRALGNALGTLLAALTGKEVIN